MWDIIYDGPHIPKKEVKKESVKKLVPRTGKEYDEADRKKIKKVKKQSSFLFVE